MKVEFTASFIKNYKRRFRHLPKTRTQFEKRLKWFVLNPQNPLLKDHALKGKMLGLRAFSVAGDVRVTYYIEENIAYFIDIGTHNQVYNL